MSSIKNVVLRGPLLSMSGYGVHSRQIAEYLLKLNEERDDIEITFDVVPWGNTPWYVDPDECDGLIGRIIQHSTKKDSYDVSLQLQLPNEWSPFLAKTNVGISAVVETDRCNPQWVECVNRMDMVIVPSQFTKDVLNNSGDVKTPVHVVPESWVPEVKNAKKNKKNNMLGDEFELRTDFNFLMVSQFTGNNPENDRKNIAYTIKWFVEQFKGNTDVGLIVKTNFGRMSASDRENTLQALGQIIMDCGVDGAQVYLLHGRMTNEEMVGLYTHPKIKALVNLTRGEGFGLPLLEAAACGLPIITTGWSAHTEFLGQGKYIKVDYSLGPVHPSRIDGAIFMEGSQWANASGDDFKRKIKRFYKASSIPAGWAEDLSKKLLKSHSPAAIGKHYKRVLKNII